MPSVKKLDGSAAADVGTKLMRAYHGAAQESVIIVVASALVASWLRLPALSALWTTPYGSTLFRKIIFVLIILAFGFYHWRRIVVRPWTDDTRFRFMRSAIGEL